MLASVRTDPRLGPDVAAFGPLAEAIQCLGNGAVRLLAGQSPDEAADRRVRAPAVLSRSVAGTVSRMWSPPRQWSSNSMCSAASFTTISSMTARTMRFRVRAVALGCVQTVSRSAPSASRRARSSESRSFHRRSSSAVTRRFAGSTASYWRRARSAVPRLGQHQLRVVSSVGALLFAHRHRLESRLDAKRAQDFRGHRRVDAHAAECDAPVLRPMVETRTATATANALALDAAVGNVDPSSAMPATQQTGEQPLAAVNAVEPDLLSPGRASDKPASARTLGPAADLAARSRRRSAIWVVRFLRRLSRSHLTPTRTAAPESCAGPAPSPDQRTGEACP